MLMLIKEKSLQEYKSCNPERNQYKVINDKMDKSNVHMNIVMLHHYFATVKSVKIVISSCGVYVYLYRL